MNGLIYIIPRYAFSDASSMSRPSSLWIYVNWTANLKPSLRMTSNPDHVTRSKRPSRIAQDQRSSTGWTRSSTSKEPVGRKYISVLFAEMFGCLRGRELSYDVDYDRKPLFLELGPNLIQDVWL